MARVRYLVGKQVGHGFSACRVALQVLGSQRRHDMKIGLHGGGPAHGVMVIAALIEGAVVGETLFGFMLMTAWSAAAAIGVEFGSLAIANIFKEWAHEKFARVHEWVLDEKATHEHTTRGAG